MATRPKPDPKAVEEASKKLAEKLADGDKPAEKKADTKAPVKKPVKKPLALYETEGEIKDGAKVKIGLPSLAPGGGMVEKYFHVPKTWKIAGPAGRPQHVHVIDPDRPEKTLCTLPTTWSTGIEYYPKGTYITCTFCAKRLIAVNKYTEAEYAKAKKEAQEKRDRELLEAAAKKEAAKAKPKPKAEPKPPAAKPDPKPSAKPKAA